MSALAPSVASAQTYPAGPITIVVPNAAGGPTDALARQIGEKLSARLKQPVVIDARGGAAGIIAAEFVAHAKPDGYTLLMATTGPMAINPSMHDKLKYDPQKDFAPIGLISYSSNVLIVRGGLPAKNLRELIALAKREPARLTYGSTGVGSANHLSAEMFKTMTGTEIRHVPYKAAGTLRIDLFEERIDMVLAPEGDAYKNYVQMGKARALLVSGKARSSLFPDVLTAEEAGLKGYDVTIWFGLAAPAGTPADVVERLNRELAQVLSAPDQVRALAGDGHTIAAMTPRQFGAFMEQERRKWGPVVKASGAKLE